MLETGCNRLLFTAVIISLFIHFNTPHLFAEEEINLDKIIKKGSTGTGESASYNLEFTLQGGETVNYMSYNITSPVIGGGFGFKWIYDKSKRLKPLIKYTIFAEKYFSNAEKSDYTLNSVNQEARLGLAYKKGPLKISAEMEYDWILRPDWPDLYQPDPIIYDSAFDLNNVTYKGTDRYSYRRINPELFLRYKITSKVPLKLRAGYAKKLGYIDPAYSKAKPTHLTPDRYSETYGEIGIRHYALKRFLNYGIRNIYSVLKHDEELSRDRVTGLTHYSTAPNPLYEESHNETKFHITINLKSLKLKITPFYSYSINSDKFQGYYSYTEHDFGITLRQSFFKKKLKYTLKGERRLRTYTSDGYGASKNHFPLTDGDILYKNYWVVSADIKFRLNKNLQLFTDFFMKTKDTNYPSYSPGVNPTGNITQPGTKNYDIDFSFTNYRADMGVTYSL